MRKKEKQMVSDDGSYVVKKSKKLDILAFILCLVVAFGVWVYVMNTQNTDYTKTFTIDLKIMNAEALFEDTQYTVFDVSDKTVQLTIKGKKSEIRMLSEKDFLAYCDVSTITDIGRTRISVAVETPTASVSVVEVKPDSAVVFADYEEKKGVPCFPIYEGNDGLTFNIVGVGAGELSVKGPKMFMDQIAALHVRVPVGDYEVGQKITSTDYVFVDKDGKELTGLLYVTLGTNTFELEVGSNG